MDSKKQEDDHNPLDFDLNLPPSVGSPPPELDLLRSLDRPPPPPPLAWATDNPAIHHPLTVLVSFGVFSIHGRLQCHSCERRDNVVYNLLEKYNEVSVFLIETDNRAPYKWKHPEFPDCSQCGRAGSMRPADVECEEGINWLFLFLGQMLGWCKEEQLKWFCEHAEFDCTGSKDRLIYLSYLAICCQLQPNAPFDHLLQSIQSEERQVPEAGGQEIGSVIPLSPPFPWATDDPAIHHPLSVLVHHGIRSIHGKLWCLLCDCRTDVAYDLIEKYKEVSVFLLEQGPEMNDRVVAKWMHPEFPGCPQCGRATCMRPAVAESEERINWLFLFLGQTLGWLKNKPLKWFCKQSKAHCTGTKARLVYYSYVAICSQLQPGLFAHLL